MDATRLRALIQAELPALTGLRHDFHRHPELSYEERRTSQVVQRELSSLGIEFKAGLGGTGVVAQLSATDTRHREAPAVALRADMDALPISEQTGKPYASTTPGVMHACGHDGHTTILLGAARVLSKLERPNPVTLVFQPAEEGGAGAEKLCNEGALRGKAGGGVGAPVGRIFGLHGWPQLDVGVVASRPGPLLAATDEIEIVVRGSGGHAAYPHLCKDPIVAASHVVTALQTLVSRSVSPLDAVVCTIGSFHAGSASNIIPDAAALVGTVRTLKPETRALARERILAIAQQTAAAHACHADVTWHDGYPVTSNDAGATEQFFAAARDAVGPTNTRLVPDPTMGAEDFSYYGHHVPACFFFLGLKPRGRDTYPVLHSPQFDFNDEALPLGIEMMCRLATAD